MSGICGFVADESPAVGEAALGTLLGVLARYPHASVERARVGARVFLGRVARQAAVERHEALGTWRDGPWTFVAEARLDEPKAAARRLGVAAGSACSDGALVGHALARDDEGALATLFGDWTIAGWNARDESLTLAREPNGFDALYYVEVPGGLAFASSLGPLLALDDCPRDLDELMIARSMTRFDGGRDDNTTVFPAIHYLPPGQILRYRGKRITLHRYWKLEESIPELSIGYAAAAEELRRLVHRSVVRRTQRHANIGATLSSGLDSSGIVALAARELGDDGQKLDAYCSVPLFPDACVTPAGRYANEGPIAAAFAATFDNVRYSPIDGAGITPIEGIERTIEHLCRPAYATSNDFWLHATYAQAAANGNSVVLNGGLGNVTMSYGYLHTQPALSLVSNGRWRAAAIRARRVGKQFIKQHFQRNFTMDARAWGHSSCIGPAFAARLRLAERMHETGHDPIAAGQLQSSGQAERLSWFEPLHGSNVFQDMLARSHGVDILDPSTDTELLLFTLGLPERVFTGPRQEVRWLYREAMRGVLPENIRTGNQRGYQAADLIARLQADAERMEDLLARLERHALAREAIDVTRLRTTWQQILRENTISAHRDAWNILLNGVATGSFLLRYN